MAHIADIDLHVAFGGTGLKLVAAGALDSDDLIFGMDSLLHFILLLEKKFY
jgi:hypothetical protein